MHTIEIAGKKLVVYDKVFEPYYTARDDTLFNLPEFDNCRTILDMGTGTGILPIMWAERYPQLGKIYAVDKCPNAVDNAKVNIEKNVPQESQSKITVIQSDLFENVPTRCQFDAIVFNAPHVNREDEQKHSEFGDELYYSLFDPDLEIARCFFEQASKYLKQDGFIIYTFSDYGDIERLFEVINQSEWVATLISAVPFQDRDLPNYSGWKGPLWYNLTVKHPQYCSVGEVTLGFQEAIHVLFDSVKRITRKKEYEEVRERVNILLKGLTLQIGTLLASRYSIRKDCWIMCGFPTQSWGAEELHYEFFLGCDPKIDRIERECFEKKVRNFTRILEGKLDNQIEFIVDYLPKSEKYDVIKAIKADRAGNSISVYPESGFVKLLRIESSIENICNIDFESDDFESKRSAIKEHFRTVIGNLQLMGFQEDDEELGIARNAFLNFYVLTLSGQPLRFMYFKRYRLPTMGQDSTIYFFSSIPSDDSRACRVILRLLEVYKYVGMLIQEPIWRTIRQKFALQSAVAAIMARNMSHILGSQILMRAKGERDIDSRDQLLDYIISRCEYIADVTGESSLIWGPGIIERTNGREKIGVIPELTEANRLILQKFKEAAGGKFNNLSIEAVNLEEQIGFPFGAPIGGHAIYGMLENYIRNVSKYGYLKNRKLEITLKGQEEKNERFIKVGLSSNSEIIDEKDFESLNLKDKNEIQQVFKKYGLDENIKKELSAIKNNEELKKACRKACLKKSASEIHQYTIRPIIDETGKPYPKGWGIQEMRTHACLLAGKDINQLAKEEELEFFKFDREEAAKNGSYTFYFKVRKYVDTVPLKNDEIPTFVNNPLGYPLCDFIIVEGEQALDLYKKNWHKFPIRTCIIGQKNGSEVWWGKKIVWIEDEDAEDLSKLFERFWELLKAQGAIEYSIKLFDDNSSIHIDCNEFSERRIALYHQGSGICKESAKKYAQQKIARFSHQKSMLIWMNSLKEEKSKKKKIARIKWRILLGTKMLIIDDRTWEKYEEMEENARKEMKMLGVDIIPENVKINEKLKINKDIDLKEIQFVSVHLGYLEQNSDSPLLKEELLNEFPPFIFTHTGRGKVDRDFVNKYFWLKKVISVGTLMSAFNEKYALEIKIRLLEVFLTPQQGGIK